MKTLKIALVLAVMAMTGSAADCAAQIYVKIRPSRPHYERTVAPSPRHVWVDEEWTPSGESYTWAGGHWVERPRERAVWVPGHWKDTRRGAVWIAGHWRG